MNKNDKKMNNKGFSLVELIIVIAIMAILVGVLAPSLYKYVQKSKEATDITNLDTCVSAIKVYYADKDFPAGGKVTISVDGGILKATPNDALVDAQCDKSPVKGTWTNFGAEVKSDGTVTYTGTGSFYEQDGTKGFKTKTTTTE